LQKSQVNPCLLFSCRFSENAFSQVKRPNLGPQEAAVPVYIKEGTQETPILANIEEGTQKAVVPVYIEENTQEAALPVYTV